ncbi:hypothetical protein [Arsenicibacter rosenii]|nr:hypothetical protein [Arsenicibacter rosenii]
MFYITVLIVAGFALFLLIIYLAGSWRGYQRYRREQARRDPLADAMTTAYLKGRASRLAPRNAVIDFVLTLFK